MKRVLVTGAGGFLGRHVVQLLRARGDEVISLGRRPLGGPGRSVQVDLRDAAATRAALAKLDADAVVHLAGDREGSLEALVQANVLATHALLEACLRWPRPPRVVLLGSAAQYGLPRHPSLAVDESEPQQPITDYGLAKAWAEQLGLRYQRLHGLPLVVARVFNVCGPGESEATVLGAALAQLGAGREEIVLGRLDTERDFLDVRDVAAALVALLERGEAGAAYNVCSGRATRVRALVAELLRLSGRPARLVERSGRAKTLEVASIHGSPRRLRETTGWAPAVPLEASLRDALVEALGNPAAP